MKDNDFLVNAPEGEVYPYIDNAKEYLLAGKGADVHLYKKGEFDSAKPIMFSWRSNCALEKISLEYGTEKDLLDAAKIILGGDSSECAVGNLYKGKKYYWRIMAVDKSGDSVVKTGSFNTTDLGPRVMLIDNIFNVRDIGGYMTSYGKKTRQGLIYRGGAMMPEGPFTPELSEKGKRCMSEELKIRTEVDLRGCPEGKEPCYESCIPEARVVYITTDGYHGAFELTENFRQVFALMADRKNYPMYLHCTGGADRTATVVFLVDVLLGVGEDDLVVDYEYTSFSQYGERKHTGDLQVIYRRLEAFEGENLQEKVHNYMLSIGMTEEQLTEIRDIMLED